MYVTVRHFYDFVNHLYEYKLNVGIHTVLLPLIINRNYSKIIKSDWVSTAMISALIGQCKWGHMHDA